MGSVLSLAKIIIVLTFIWTFAECMLPDSKYKKYTDFIYGLILTAAVASFIANFNFEVPAAEEYDVGAVYGSGYVKSLYETEAEKLLREKFGDASIEITLNDDCTLKSLKCKDKQIYNRIKEYLYGQ